MIEKKLKKLLNDSKDFEKRSHKVFAPIDDDKLIRELKIKEKAIEDGAKNSPSSTSSQLSSTELQIQSEFKNIAVHYAEDHDQLKGMYAASIKVFNDEVTVDAVLNKERESLNQIYARAKSRIARVYDLQESLKAARNELWDFRRLHQLTDRLPDRPNPWFTAVILLLVVLFELFLTAALIRESSGLVMVVLTAVIYCGLNAALPFFAAKTFGKWIRYIPASFRGYRIVGWSVMALVSLVALMVNLMLAHLREQATAAARAAAEATSQIEFEQSVMQALSASSRAIESMSSSPFGFSEAYTYLMFFLGLGLFLVALFDGLNYGDKYPDYHFKAEKFRVAFDDYQSELEYVMSEIEGQRSKYVREIEESKAFLKEAIKTANRWLDYHTSITLRCRQALESLDLKYQRVLRLYRENNISARGDPAPSFYEEGSSLPTVELFDPDPPVVNESAVRDKIDLLSNFSGEAHNKFEELIEAMMTADEVLDGHYPLRVDA